MIETIANYVQRKQPSEKPCKNASAKRCSLEKWKGQRLIPEIASYITQYRNRNLPEKLETKKLYLICSLDSECNKSSGGYRCGYHRRREMTIGTLCGGHIRCEECPQLGKLIVHQKVTHQDEYFAQSERQSE